MNIDVASVDQALMTTRAVRRRLDLERPVDIQVLFDCIDIAEQAPSGGNQTSRRWVIVVDQARKDQIAELYMKTVGEWMIATHERIEGTGHPQEKTMRSAAYLAEHLAEVPAIVIPTIIGVHDGSGRPGLFDSVIQSVWSFSVALRARGLGSAWTTAHLGNHEGMADLLGIPEGMTQIAMLPVAWTKGTNFRMAPRPPARELAYVDGFGHTWERGPSDPPVFADGPGAVVEIDIKAKPPDVWPHIADINVGVGASDEFTGAEWVDGSPGPEVGAQFVGRNRNDAAGVEWETTSTVERCDEGREFAWVVGDPDDAISRWRFELIGIAGATRLRYAVRLGPGESGLTSAIDQHPEAEARIIGRRVDTLLGNMTRVLEVIKQRVEAATTPC